MGEELTLTTFRFLRLFILLQISRDFCAQLKLRVSAYLKFDRYGSQRNKCTFSLTKKMGHTAHLQDQGKLKKSYKNDMYMYKINDLLQKRFRTCVQ